MGPPDSEHGSADVSRAYVRAHLEALETIVADRLLLEGQDRVADPLRGLRITAEQLQDELRRKPAGPTSNVRELGDTFVRKIVGALDEVPEVDQPRLHRLCRRLGLDDLDIALLVIAAAPELDRRFERFYSFLNDDVSLRRATVGLALELAGLERDDPHARVRLGPDGALHRLGLIDLQLVDRPVLSRTLQVHEHVVEHVIGGDPTDVDLEALLRPRQADPAAASADLIGALKAGTRLLYCREITGADAFAEVCDAVTAAGLAPLVVDLDGADSADLARAVVRAASLSGAVPVVRPPSGAAPLAMRRRIDALLAVPWSVVVVGSGQWEPSWSDELPYQHDARRLTGSERLSIWADTLAKLDHEVPDADAAAGAFRLTAHQIRRVAAGAAQLAALDGRPVNAEDLRDQARGQNNAALERVAVRVHPRAGWDDLVLRPDQLDRLREVEVRSRHADLVLNQWGMGDGSRRRGIISLFAGPPGTGKTMAAEVIGDALGLDLYVINLATVIDKYIGETEKNLERVFEAATGVNGILFFDEADALFGKRSEVKDARDRYANVETAYLLQRLERFEGTAILATNLKANIDEAFSRRIDVFVDFPMPEADERVRIWTSALARSLPVGTDVDIEFLARSFELGGGNIVNVVVTAAYLAAETTGTVGMRELVRATGREYRKLGRLCTKTEFGEYLHLAELG